MTHGRSHERGVYYPLRGNAHALVAGAPFRSFVRRLKVASLLHDRVLLDGGVWQGSAGPQGAAEQRFRAHVVPSPRLQTSRERSRAQSGSFYVAIKPSDSPSPPHPVVHSPATISWRATFEPIRAELPRAFPWIDFVEIELVPGWKRAADDMARTDQHDVALTARFPDQFVRSLIAKGATHALLTGVALGTSVSLDSVHAQVLAARLARGEAEPVLGPNALLAVVPDVRDLSWEQLDAVKELPGLPRLRSVLADIEQAVREAGPSEETLDSDLARAFQTEYSRAVAEAEGGWGGVLASTAIGVAVSIATSQLGPAESLVAGSTAGAIIETAQLLHGQRRRRNSWMVAADELRAMTSWGR